jgi:hypothetical protein
MKLKTQKPSLHVAWIALAVLVAAATFASPVESGMECAGMSHWSATNPPINQQHVFCGEWNSRKNRPAGFHSRPAGENPDTIGTLTITQSPNAKGLYGVRWTYDGHPDRAKFSTMFPDTCDRDQVLRSIVYAVNHSWACPDGAPRWATCGPNKPPGDNPDYCEAADGSLFTIAFAALRDSNNVNTAFPIAE